MSTLYQSSKREERLSKPVLPQVKLQEKIYEYSDDLCENLHLVKKISLCKQKLKKIPDLSRFKTSLTYLDLSYNELDEIPDLSMLTSLTYLRLSHNKLKEIVNDKLPNSIENLELDFNEFEDFPIFLPNNLKILNIANNNLTNILGLLEKNYDFITSIDCNNNKIEILPEPTKYKYPIKLKNLHINNNPVITNLKNHGQELKMLNKFSKCKNQITLHFELIKYK